MFLRLSSLLNRLVNALGDRCVVADACAVGPGVCRAFAGIELSQHPQPPIHILVVAYNKQIIPLVSTSCETQFPVENEDVTDGIRNVFPDIRPLQGGDGDAGGDGDVAVAAYTFSYASFSHNCFVHVALVPYFVLLTNGPPTFAWARLCACVVDDNYGCSGVVFASFTSSVFIVSRRIRNILKTRRRSQRIPTIIFIDGYAEPPNFLTLINDLWSPTSPLVTNVDKELKTPIVLKCNPPQNQTLLSLECQSILHNKTSML